MKIHQNGITILIDQAEILQLIESALEDDPNYVLAALYGKDVLDNESYLDSMTECEFTHDGEHVRLVFSTEES